VARTEGRDEWMDRHSHLGIKLGIKYCIRSPPGVKDRTGYKYEPWMYVIVIEHSHNKTGFTPNFRVL
jgi:hypothetical protein